MSSLQDLAGIASWSLRALASGHREAAREAWSKKAPGRSSLRRPTPYAISFLVTARCTQKCIHCFYHYASSTPKTELSLDEYRRLSRSLGPFTVGLFCGGEPYIRPDIAEIIILLRKNHGVPLAATTTSGQHPDAIVSRTEEILRADPNKPFGVGFSIDGPREVHDLIRGRGSFDRVIASYRACQELTRHYRNLSLTVTSVMQAANDRHLPSFVTWTTRNLAPTSHCILLARQNPRGGESVKQVNMEHYRDAQREAVRAMRQAHPLGRLRPDALYLEAVARHVVQTKETSVRSFSCLAGVNGALIDPVGEVLSETAGAPTIGSLRDFDMNFPALWNSQRADAMRAMVNCHDACRACTHETMGHATSIVFPPNTLVPRRRR